jgi:hypothetical protein
MKNWVRDNTPNVNGWRETEKFVDYWRAQPGQRGVKVDWPATWRNWMRRASEGAPGSNGTNGHQPKRSTTDERVAQGRALKAQIRAQEQKAVGS